MCIRDSIHIGAGEVVGEYTDEDGNLKMPKDQVIRAMEMEKAKAPFPRSYEIETAIEMVQDDFDDSGEPKPDMEPAMDAEQPADEGNAFAQAVQKAKAAGMKAGDKFKVGDQEYTLKDAIELAGLQLEDFFSEEEQAYDNQIDRIKNLAFYQ